MKEKKITLVIITQKKLRTANTKERPFHFIAEAVKCA